MNEMQRMHDYVDGRVSKYGEAMRAFPKQLRAGLIDAYCEGAIQALRGQDKPREAPHETRSDGGGADGGGVLSGLRVDAPVPELVGDELRLEPGDE